MSRLRLLAFAGLLTLQMSSAYAQLFVFDSGVQTKKDGTTWSISIQEIERLPRVSVVEIKTVGRPQSASGAITVGCAVVKLARERDWHYVTQVRVGGVVKFGALDNPDDNPEKTLGAEFANPTKQKVADIEKFGWLCDFLSKKEAPIINGG